MLDDEFAILGLSGDEFKAWSLFLLRVKAIGARGTVPVTSLGSLARNWNLPETAIKSMLTKAYTYPDRSGKPGERIVERAGRWYVKNWKKYQEDYKHANTDDSGELKGPSSEFPEHPPEGTTPPHPTLPNTTQQRSKDTVSRKKAVDVKDLQNQDFVLRLDPSELKIFESDVQQLIRNENVGRNGGAFVWDVKRGGFESDIKKLIYSGFTDAQKRDILIQAYNLLDGKLNWPQYVRTAILYTVRSSRKVRIDSAHGFTVNILKQPGKLEREAKDGILR